MNQNNILIAASLIVGIIISVGAVFVSQGANSSARAALDAAQSAIAHAAGSVTSPDIASRYLCWGGGVCEYRASIAMAATSSVPCSFISPSATSTLLSFTGLVSGNGMGAQTADVGTSTTALGTSTPAIMWAAAIATGQTNLAWMPNGVSSTTNTRILGADSNGPSGNSPFMLPPNTMVNFRIATATPGTFASYLTGVCKVRFLSLDH